jgi:hypothetical protein
VPKSRIRRKESYTPKAVTAKAQKPVRIGSGRWVVPTMIALFLIGLVWIVAFYITQGDLPLMREFGNWNILIGFTFIGAGFVVSTRWK